MHSDKSAVNVSIGHMSCIQFLIPAGNYEIAVNFNTSLMHVFPLQKSGDNPRAPSLSEFVNLLQTNTPRTAPKSAPKAKPKAMPLVWTDADREIMQRKWKELDELCDLHAKSAAYYERKEKCIFVESASTFLIFI